ncbi:MAG: aminotransferase class I/II-fold pyridoxal phosphate-dependent enzyme [Arenicellales bacterium]|nr:aminotransferase class I/II-fold pyridoxal phosphate-dependent enzyme [Arenicellales bacterium]MDP7451734.1 aminotransferase class I/II-fold pyridoxal phosphate-dependent enzyme [Arenicellales bacterium]MDP7616145.1 aminotransferase class I/II-fold pyridoxal phosphate-dependent enzyme [Arenicellales bacterium]HJL51612.1 aminotransferase class I/II-fold pyridoxal phosphate-dependent enzyme [Arenicellales bacterium]
MSNDNSPTRGFMTRAVHSGESPDAATGASAPNIVMSSTFVIDEPISFSAQDKPDDAPYVYSRWDNPTVTVLQDKLAALEEAEACRCFASGMAATSALLLSTLSQGDRLVMSDSNYPGTAELARKTLTRLGVDVILADLSDLEAAARAITAGVRLVWAETPANPTLRLTDIRGVAELAHSVGAEFAVDSTFASPVATRPLLLGADYVVHSLTKYCCGHGDAMGGAVLGRRDKLKNVESDGQIYMGGVISPFNAWLINRGLATLPMRMQVHQTNATRVAEFLEGHKKVKKVLYPGLSSHPQFDLAVRQMDNYSGMVSVQVEDGPVLVERMMSDLKIFHYAVSLGHHRSLIYWLGTDDLMQSSYALEGRALDAYRAFAGDGVFRISVGLEDPEDLCDDLAQILG